MKRAFLAIALALCLGSVAQAQCAVGSVFVPQQTFFPQSVAFVGSPSFGSSVIVNGGVFGNAVVVNRGFGGNVAVVGGNRAVVVNRGAARGNVTVVRTGLFGRTVVVNR